MKPNKKLMSKHSKPPLSYAIKQVSWQSAVRQLSQIRHQVFIIEQQVPVDLEWDGLDASALHLLAIDNQANPLGCARILSDGSIGRMAVLKQHRQAGVGSALLQTAIACCQQCGWLEISLSAQVQAIGFYERAGFMLCSQEYLDAGIPHRDMKLRLNN